MEDRIGGRDARERQVIHHFLDPTLPEVRDHTVEIVAEIVSNYDIDGLVLDDLRYPIDGSMWGYSARSLES